MTAVLALADISKDYGALRPLRIARLEVAAGDRIAILGLDRVAAEVFVNLVTGATLPERGEVTLFGRATTTIVDGADWLTTVDRFGIVSDRSVLLDGLSVMQNLAMPFTLDIEPPAPEVRDRAIALAREVELAESRWARPAGELDRAARVRLRIARAIALDPAIVLLEHPTADLPRSDVTPLGERIRLIAGRRRVATVALTADDEFARTAADRVLRLDAASGRLAPR